MMGMLGTPALTSSVGAASGGGGFMASIGGGGTTGSMTELGGLIAAGVGQMMQGKRAGKEAKKAREWAQMMRATAYQTAVKDMRRAGLNPILSVTGPGPAHTPSGPVADVPRYGEAQAEIMEGMAGRLLGSAKQFSILQNQAKTIDAQRRTAEAEASVSERTVDSRIQNMFQTAYRTGVEGMLMEDQAMQSRAQRKRIETSTALDRTLLPAARAEMDMDESEFGTNLRKFRRVMEALPILGGSVGRTRVRSR